MPHSNSNEHCGGSAHAAGTAAKEIVCSYNNKNVHYDCDLSILKRSRVRLGRACDVCASIFRLNNNKQPPRCCNPLLFLPATTTSAARRKAAFSDRRAASSDSAHQNKTSVKDVKSMERRQRQRRTERQGTRRTTSVPLRLTGLRYLS